MEQTLWLARDKDGYLFLFKKKPFRCGTYFSDNYDGFQLRSEKIQLKKDLYPNVTFENSPHEVKLEFI